MYQQIVYYINVLNQKYYDTTFIIINLIDNTLREKGGD